MSETPPPPPPPRMTPPKMSPPADAGIRPRKASHGGMFAHVWAVVIGVVFIVMQAIFQLVALPEQNVAYEAGQAMGTLGVGLVIYFGISWVAYLIAGKSRLAGSITLIILCGMGAAGSGLQSLSRVVAKTQEDAEVAEVQAEVDSILEASRDRQREQFERDGYVEGDHEAVDEIIQLQRERAVAADDPQTAAVHRASAGFLAEIGLASQAYEDALNRFVSAGGSGFEGLESPTKLAERGISLNVFADANQALLTVLKGRRDLYERLLREEGANQTVIPSVLAGMDKSSAGFQIQIMLRESDERFVQCIREQFALLAEYQGRWTIDAEESVLFDDDVPDQVIDRLNELYTLELEYLEEQDLLQRQLLEARGVLPADQPPSP